MSASYMLSILRIVVGLLFLEHGSQKILGFPHDPALHAAAHAAINTSASFMTVLHQSSGYFELIGGILFTLGLLTRPVAFILCGEMAVAYFMVHAHGSFYPIINKGELAVIYCFVFLYFFFSGGGIIALDSVIKRR